MTQENKMDAWKHNYEALKELDLEYTKLRWTVFPALMSISFLVSGLAFTAGGDIKNEVRKLALIFGYMIYLVAIYFYWWLHRISHRLRDELIKIEDQYQMNAYRLRIERPKVFGIKLYFHWALIALSLLYAAFIIYYMVKF